MCPGIKVSSSPDMQMFVAQSLGLNSVWRLLPPTDSPSETSLLQEKVVLASATFLRAKITIRAGSCRQVGRWATEIQDHQTALKHQIHDDFSGYPLVN